MDHQLTSTRMHEALDPSKKEPKKIPEVQCGVEDRN